MLVCEVAMAGRKSRASSSGHRFGGDWTETKLRLLSDYLSAYATALKNQPFAKIYVDAFAGTRYREERGGDETEHEPLLFLRIPGIVITQIAPS
jgi:hypothetical protein